MFNPIPQLAGFVIAITFMSLPFVALTTLPLASFGLLKLGELLGLLGREEPDFALAPETETAR